MPTLNAIPPATAMPQVSAATNIQEVIEQLDSIIDWSIKNKSRIGYFATLYRNMTKAVQHGIATNQFADGKRMERLDVIFANRYISAWKAYMSKQPCTSAWCVVFDACETTQLIVLQHLVLGINTHINLDLGIAAAETAPGNAIEALRGDFEKINDVISAESEKLQAALCRVWFPLRLLNKISNNREDAVINFSIKLARQASWTNAVALALKTGQARTNHINLIDNGVVLIARRIIKPSFFTSCLLWPVRYMEDKDVGKLIGLLQ